MIFFFEIGIKAEYLSRVRPFKSIINFKELPVPIYKSTLHQLFITQANIADPMKRRYLQQVSPFMNHMFLC